MDRLLAIQSRRLLRRNNVAVEWSEFEEVLCSHPDYPSLLALTETLELYRIEYAALKINPEDMEANGFPFLAHLKEKQGNYVVVTGYRKGKVEYIDNKEGKKRENLGDFCARWEGVAVYVASACKRVFPRMGMERCVFLGLILWLLMIGYCLGKGMSWMFVYQGYGLIKVIGFVLSCMLLLHELGEGQEGWMQKICHFSKKSDCDKVLNSGASRLFGISLADIGTVYFAGGILYWWIGDEIQLLFYLSLCVFPYTLFSLWYQLRKVRRICLFCMGVVLCLWGEVSVSVFFALPLNLSWKLMRECVGALCCFGGVVGCVYLLKRMIKYRQEAHWLKVNNLKLKREKVVYGALQSEMPEVEPEYSDSDIIFYEGSGERKVIVVLSPFCNPCVGLHERLERLTEKYICDFTVVLRFIGTPGIEKESVNQVTLGLIEVYHTQGREAFRRALSVWFQKRMPEHLPIGKYSSRTIRTLADSVAWCERVGIHSTPLILVGKRILPPYYGVEDLGYLNNF